MTSPNSTAAGERRAALYDAFLSGVREVVYLQLDNRVNALRTDRPAQKVDADLVAAVLHERLGGVVGTADARAVASAVRGAAKLAAPYTLFGGAE